MTAALQLILLFRCRWVKCRTVKYSHSTVMLRELLALPCSFSARQRYCPSPCGVISAISSTDSSSAVMVPTSSPSFSQVRVGAGFPWVLQCRDRDCPSWTTMESFTRGSRGGSAKYKFRFVIFPQGENACTHAKASLF